MLSAGTPLVAGGDEYLRSLQCNNNPYDVDSVANWLNYTWNRLTRPTSTPFVTGTDRLPQGARRALRPPSFYSGAQLAWWTPAGAQRRTRAYMDERQQPRHRLPVQPAAPSLNEISSSIYVAYNGWSAERELHPAARRAMATSWYRVTDTCGWAEGPGQVRAPGAEDAMGGQGVVYSVCGRGLLLLLAKPAPTK
jgi:isoamylase